MSEWSVNTENSRNKQIRAHLSRLQSQSFIGTNSVSTPVSVPAQVRQRLLLTCYICLDVLTISNSCLFPPPPTSYHRHPPKCSNLYPLPLPPLAQNTPTTPACWWWRQMGRWGSLTYTIYKYHLYSVHTLYKLIQTPNVCGLLSDPDCSSSMISITMRAVMRNNII